ncbi:MAG: DUF2778 domain-containing protein [Xanthobacteraceae bacterium]|nr:DUF2778 domain-containing protein [Xanthobacteraceae bacterium]
MNYRSETSGGFQARERVALSTKAVRQTFFGGLTLACAGSVCVWILNASLTSPAEPAAPLPQKVVNVKPIPARVVLDQYASLFDSTSSLGAPPTNFTVPASFESRWAAVSPEQASPKIAMAVTKEVQPATNVVQEVASAIPLPMPRPAASIRAAEATGPSKEEAAKANKVASLAPSQPEKPLSIFEKLFGRFQPARQTLAYASPDGGLGEEAFSSGRFDRNTAVYDISARAVYLPDGRKLEAHSGLGDMLDDPRYVDRRMRGATPPATYDLKLREALFHGVEAIRLTPVEGTTFGRTGLLAHTYMLGPNGDSNGCVSFKDYNTFLQAFKKQEIKKLVVVAKL